MNILSVQSSVAYGHVGNTAATFPLQRLGAEVWAVDTVSFSNHPGYGDWTGRAATGAEVAALLEGVARRGALARCDALLSGYLGDVAVGQAVADAAMLLRAANPAALYCCDPVIGDGGREYVRPGIAALIAQRCVPVADLLTPNQFELERLAGTPCRSRRDVRAALAGLRERMRPAGPRVVLLTSAQLDATPADTLDVVAADAAGVHALRVPKRQVAASGAGDLLAALFLFHFLRAGAARPAMERSVAAVQGVLARTEADGAADLRIVAAQDELVRPTLQLSAGEF